PIGRRPGREKKEPGGAEGGADGLDAFEALRRHPGPIDPGHVSSITPQEQQVQVRGAAQIDALAGEGQVVSPDDGGDEFRTIRGPSREHAESSTGRNVETKDSLRSPPSEYTGWAS